MSDAYKRLDELTRIRNDFHRAIMREPERRAELSEHVSRVEEARLDEGARLLHAGLSEDEIRAHLDQSELIDPGRTGIGVPVGEAEAYFAGPGAEPQAELEL